MIGRKDGKGIEGASGKRGRGGAGQFSYTSFLEEQGIKPLADDAFRPPEAGDRGEEGEEGGMRGEDMDYGDL